MHFFKAYLKSAIAKYVCTETTFSHVVKTRIEGLETALIVETMLDIVKF